MKCIMKQPGFGRPLKLTIGKRPVSSLSPLGSAFNSRPQKSSFFPRQTWNSNCSEKTGLFQFPELTKPEGFLDLKVECGRKSQELVDEACSHPRERKRIVARVFDELSDELCKVADMAEFVRLAHPDRVMAAAAENACIDVSGLVERLNTDIQLFEALRQSVEGDSDKEFPHEEVDKHVAKLFLLDFYQCGIHLPEGERERVVELNDSILQIGQHFAASCHRPRVVKKIDLPSKIRHHFNIDGDNVVLSGLPVDTPHDLAREAGYKIFYWEDPSQEKCLATMLNLRQELGRLCGYETFAHRAMSESLGGSPSNVSAFLEKLSQALKAQAAKDYDVMLKMKRRASTLSSTALNVWDIPYFSMQARSQLFDADSAKIAEYFSLGVCMEGLDRLFNTLYGVRLHLAEAQPGELWHKDVYKLSVQEVSDGSELGVIYCDFFSRAGKPQQDCHFTIRGGRLRDNDQSYQNPVVVLFLSLPPPGWSRPTLLTATMIDNLFHEMGHAMHSMLARTKYQHVTGTRTATDFAEVPSTLMEYFASDPRVLHEMSNHFQSGQKLPIDVLQKFVTARKVFMAPDLQSQLCYSLLDQNLHQGDLNERTTTDIMQQIHTAHHNLPFPEGTAWQHRFSHLVGYGARYYSYLLARSVASNIWQKLFRDDPFDPSKGAIFRNKCLSHGGGKPSADIISDLLDQKVEPIDLADALLTEIDEKQQMVQFLGNK